MCRIKLTRVILQHCALWLFLGKTGFALSAKFQRPLSARTHRRQTRCSTFGLLFGSLTSLISAARSVAAGSFHQEILMCPCLRLRGGFTGAWSAETRSCFAPVCMQTASSGWKRGNWLLSPPPRGNHAEYLWSKPKSRKAADYQAPAARRLPAV